MRCAHCAFVTADPSAAFCPNCGTAASMPDHRGGPAPERVSTLGTAARVLLFCVAAAQLLYAAARLARYDVPGISEATAVAEVATVPVFLVWFCRVRGNAGLWGPQRRSPGWCIGGWFTPVVALWFPFQILVDVWRASEPATETPRRDALALAKAWWACWILAWFTGVSTKHITIIGPDGGPTASTYIGVTLGGRVISSVFTAATAVLALLIVGRVTRMQEARIATA